MAVCTAEEMLHREDPPGTPEVETLVPPFSRPERPGASVL